jgi:hypothetical protein
MAKEGHGGGGDSYCSRRKNCRTRYKALPRGMPGTHFAGKKILKADEHGTKIDTAPANR